MSDYVKLVPTRWTWETDVERGIVFFHAAQITVSKGKPMSTQSDGNPYSSPHEVSGLRSPPAPLKEMDYFLAWLCFFLSATVAGFFAGAFAGGVIGFVLGGAGQSLDTIRGVAMIVAFITGLPISYAFFRLFVGRMIVGKIVNTGE
jgi:hypothetical protein